MTTLLVASSGGHLRQLHRLRPRLGLDDDYVWVTFAGPQSHALLKDDSVIHLHYVGPRDAGAILRNLPAARRVVRRSRADRVVSTGSGIALAVLPQARVNGVECHYIESATRQLGPSITGRILQRVPGVLLYAQSSRWSSDRWTYAGSVLEGFRAHTKQAPPASITRAVVTVGTIERFEFSRLIARVRDILPEEVEIFWQTGATDLRQLGIKTQRVVATHELHAAMLDADVVIAHAGLGSALDAFECGKMPVLVSRRKAFREHVDDHQHELALELAARGLALHRDPEDLHLADLEIASRHEIVELPVTTPIRLKRSVESGMHAR